MTQKFKETAQFILNHVDYTPTVGIILGSGLGALADKIESPTVIEYNDIPNFPESTVEGHAGRLIMGNFGNKKVVAMQGRFHYYEGYGMDQVTFPVRVMKFLGVETLVVSNAAGGLNPDYKQGDLMLINDHINFFPQNALLGKNFDELGERFPDMSKTYHAKYREEAKKIATENNIELREGVYIGSSGPSLETPAEYRMFRIFGADATGMSTVPEVLVAHQMGIKIFGMSVITNVSEPVDPNQETTHGEVQDVAGMKEPEMSLLVEKLIERI